MLTHEGLPLRRIKIFDTTLRDGEQAPGNAMRPEQKLDIALAIESLGVDVIEAGFPSSSPSDREAARLLAESLTAARVATLNRPLPDDVRLAVESAGTERHHLQVMATGSEIHLKHKRGLEQAEAQDQVVDAIGFAKSLGVKNVTLAIEDASRGSDGLLRPLITESIAAGADTVTIADTTGCMMPAEYGRLIVRIRSWIPAEIVVSTHCHEDLGLSLANALAGIEAGADEVQATLAGIGERAGNTSLEELIAVLTYNGAAMGATTSAKTEGLYAAFEILCRVIGLSAPRNKAIFGVNAFATQAGIHQAGILRAPITYEYVEPALFGRERTILVGRHSGRAVLRYVLDEMKLPLDEQLVDRLYEEHIAHRTNGECIDLAGLRGLIAENHTMGSGAQT
ncbi:pyruvate carboxyltransferase [Streptomyces sp. P9-2B-2]|uniref:LeuA family protein n=1 Tax=Streptomyces sp. P9-2B-2 TaxID=3057114 RepID=UPI0025B28233|nr:pyruvate carboxyltransferase [Streptomyces sp. P9-2B-2]WJY37092.1 pyruvate carboxyltransferase [Streptomyces sp. P9-2B-2]